MKENNYKYKYALIDLSYILARNAYSVFKQNPKCTSGDMIKSLIWTLNKISRDYKIEADKFILVSDKWRDDIGGYYTTYMLNGNYKTDRGDGKITKGHGTYVTPEVYEEMKLDPTITEEDLKAAEEKLRFNTVKQGAKAAILDDLGRIGIPSIYLPGWEYDNLAWLATNLLFNKDNPLEQKSILITGDSDLLFSLSPQMDYFKIPLRGKNPKVITYQEVYDKEMPDALKDKISLYSLHAMLDSLGEGHNMMTRTKKLGANGKAVVEEIILQGKMDNVSDPELFRLQYNTFDISKYPGYDTAVDLIRSLPRIGHYGNLEDLHWLLNKHSIKSGISDKYFSDFEKRFNQKLFSE